MKTKDIENAFKGHFYKIEPPSPWPDPPAHKSASVNSDFLTSQNGVKDKIKEDAFKGYFYKIEPPGSWPDPPDAP